MSGLCFGSWGSAGFELCLRFRFQFYSKRPMNPSFVFGGTAGYWVHERNKQFEQSRGAQSILA